MNTKKIQKGFTSFDLKIMALVLMLLDHIHYIFEFTGNMPVWFSWLGRISGGLFLFTMIEGYSHTSDKRKYFFRIYILGVIMSFVKYLISFSPNLIRGDGFFPQNGVLQTFSLLIIIFIGIDFIKEKKYLKGLLIIFSTTILSYMFFTFIRISPLAINLKNILYIIFTSLVPSVFVAEGGIFVVLSGIILYIFRDKRKLQAIFYSLFILAWMIIIPIMYIEPISLKLMFTDYYEWMGAFASLIFIKYNGEKGKSMKKLFYIFYPAHIYILYIISLIIYK